MRATGRLIAAPLFLLTAIVVMSAGAAYAEEVNQAVARRLNPLAQLDPASLKAFVEKPLFSPTRSPPDEVAEPQQDVAVAAPAALNIRLLGVVVTPDGSVAHILDLADNSSHSLLKGQSYQDWQAVAIDQSRLQLRKGEETASFTVFSKTGADPGADLPENPI